jgi:hypothetical protein
LGGNPNGGVRCVYGRSWQTLYYHLGSAHKSVYLFPEAHPSDFQEPAWDDPENQCGSPRGEPFTWIRGLMTAWLEYYVRGDTSYFDVLYDAGGEPRLVAETGASLATNYPQDLTVTPIGGGEAILSWGDTLTDSTVIDGYDVLAQRGGSALQLEAQLPLSVTAWRIRGLLDGTDYRFSVAYRDKDGNVFQTAPPVELAGGAPTPTPSPTAVATDTPTPISTATPDATATPANTSTPTPAAIEPRVYLPRLNRE